MRRRREYILLALPGVLLLAVFFAVVLDTGTTGGVGDPPKFASWVRALTVSPLPAEPGASLVDQTPLAVVDASDDDGNDADLSGPHDYRLLIVDENGDPIPGARITIVARPSFVLADVPEGVLGDHGSVEIPAGKTGELAFTGDPESRYEVLVRAEGYAHKRYRLRCPGKRTLRLHRKVAVWGFVYGENGGPLEGIEVELHNGLRDALVAVTDAQGVYEFKDVGPSSASVRILSPSYQWAIKHLAGMEGGGRYNLDFELSPGTRLDVQVLDRENRIAADAVVRLFELNSDLLVASSVVGPDGWSHFDALREGRSYLLEVDGGQRGFARHPVSMLQVGQATALKETVVLQGTWVAEGMAVTPEGLPVDGVRIVFESSPLTNMSSSRHRLFAWTDEFGRYRLEGLICGVEYTAFAYHRLFAIRSLSGLTSQVPATLPVDFVLENSGVIQGVLRDDQGLPVPNAVITLKLMGPKGGASLLIGRTDPNGQYFFSNLPTGMVTLQAVSMFQGQTISPTSVMVQRDATIVGHVNVSRDD